MAEFESKLIHCSFDIVDEFIPRVPISTARGEDSKTPRICVCPTIRDCIRAMAKPWKIIEWMKAAGLKPIIHAYYLKSDSVIADVTDKVPDANITHEMWITDKPNSVRRIDFEIENELFYDVTDMFGNPNKWLIGMDLKRVPFTDSMKKLCEIPRAKDLKKYLKHRSITFSSIAYNMELCHAKQWKEQREIFQQIAERGKNYEKASKRSKDLEGRTY